MLTQWSFKLAHDENKSWYGRKTSQKREENSKGWLTKSFNRFCAIFMKTEGLVANSEFLDGSLFKTALVKLFLSLGSNS